MNFEVTPQTIQLVLGVVGLIATGLSIFFKVAQKAESTRETVQQLGEYISKSLDLARQERLMLRTDLFKALSEAKADNLAALNSVRKEFADAMGGVTRTIEAQNRMIDEIVRQSTRAHERIDQIKSGFERMDKELANLRGRWLTITQKLRPIDRDEGETN